MSRFLRVGATLLAVGVGSLVSGGSAGAAPQTLTVFGAGTLAAPFHALDDAFMKAHPGIVVHAQFGGSVKMVKQITELHQTADVVAVADYSVIPKYLFGNGGTTRYAGWYVGFAGNAITFVYTDRSTFASEVTASNWYDVLSRPGVQIGRSNPDTDPSGYQTVQMLELAADYYHKPNLAPAILANAPPANIRDTETELIGALESGQIDYLAIYRSDARQHGFRYLHLPPEIDLSEPRDAAAYAAVRVKTVNGTLSAKPIVYALTIPQNAASPQLAGEYVRFLLGSEGRAIMARYGFTAFERGLAVNENALPAALHPLVRPWSPPA
jgi:molybdate/tungstate transport system substrate-binding protein